MIEYPRSYIAKPLKQQSSLSFGKTVVHQYIGSLAEEPAMMLVFNQLVRASSETTSSVEKHE
jgi:hypothetical protein